MPKYLNTNNHVIYVDDPSDDERDLTPIQAGDEVTATGRFADNLEQTPGVFRASSDEAKSFKRGESVEGQDERVYPPNAEEVLATDGEHSFPANDQEIVTPSDATPLQTPAAVEAEEHGRRMAEQQESPSVNYASDEAAERADALGLNPRDLADEDGSGKDGALTVADVKRIAEEQSQPAGAEDMSEEQLLDMASEYGINTDDLLADVPEEERREKLQAAVEDASGDLSTAAETDSEPTTATNEPDETGGTVTSDKVPKAS